jgi:hypothetical protein
VLGTRPADGNVEAMGCLAQMIPDDVQVALIQLRSADRCSQQVHSSQFKLNGTVMQQSPAKATFLTTRAYPCEDTNHGRQPTLRSSWAIYILEVQSSNHVLIISPPSCSQSPQGLTHETNYKHESMYSFIHQSISHSRRLA